jgi:hypothetical protein
VIAWTFLGSAGRAVFRIKVARPSYMGARPRLGDVEGAHYGSCVPGSCGGLKHILIVESAQRMVECH